MERMLMKHKLTRLAVLAAGLATPLALALPAAHAVTRACTTGDGGFCSGQVSKQAVPLELAVAVSIAQVTDGTKIVASTPALSGREDWDIRPATGSFRTFTFAPRGQPTNLCLTASSDVPGSQLNLRLCEPGSVGSSHQLWHPDNILGGGYVVWVNAADGMAMTVAGDTPGSPVQVRAVGAGTGGNKNFAPVPTAP